MHKSKLSSKKIINKKQGNKKGHLEWKGENWKENQVAEIEIAINIKYQDIDSDKECVVQGPVIKVPIKIKLPPV